MSFDADTPEGLPAEAGRTRRPWTNTLTRLFIVVFLAVLPALAIQTYNETQLKQSREAEVRRDALRLAKFASGEIDRIIDNGRALAVAIANLPEVRNKNAAACSEYAAALTEVFPQYLAIGAIDFDGHVFCSSCPITPGTSAADRWYFQEAVRSDKFIVGDYAIGQLVKKPILPLNLAFLGPDGRIAGVVYLSLDIDWLARYFENDRLINQDATLAIADRNAVILVRLPDNSRYVGTKFADDYRTYIFAQTPGTAEITGVDGIRRILGYVPIQSPPAIGLYIGVGLTTATAFAAVNDAARVGFILVATGLALGLLLASFGGAYFISRPLGKLVAASSYWRRGNFAARADLGRGGSEIAQLGRPLTRWRANCSGASRKMQPCSRRSKTGCKSARKSSRSGASRAEGGQCRLRGPGRATRRRQPRTPLGDAAPGAGRGQSAPSAKDRGSWAVDRWHCP